MPSSLSTVLVHSGAMQKVCQLALDLPLCPRPGLLTAWRRPWLLRKTEQTNGEVCSVFTLQRVPSQPLHFCGKLANRSLSENLDCLGVPGLLCQAWVLLNHLEGFHCVAEYCVFHVRGR